MAVVEDNPVLTAPERFDYGAFDLDFLFLFRHEPPNLVSPAHKRQKLDNSPSADPIVK
jgi:hypothetical protein